MYYIWSGGMFTYSGGKEIITIKSIEVTIIELPIVHFKLFADWVLIPAVLYITLAVH